MLACLALGMLIRLPLLTQSLWYDEVWRTRVVLTGDSAIRAIFRDVHGPLYNAFMYAWIRVVGDSELAIRLPSLLASGVTIWLVFAWCHRRLDSRIAWSVAAWLVVCPVLAWWSCQAKNNAFTLLATTFALISLDALVRDRSMSRVALAALAGTLALWTDFQSLLALFPAWGAAMFVLAREAKTPGLLARIGPVLLAASIALAAFLPLLILKASHASELSRGYLSYFGLVQFVHLFTTHIPIGDVYRFDVAGRLPWLVVMGVLVLITLAAGARALINKEASWLALSVLLGPVILMWVLSELLVASGSSQRVYQTRNLIVIVPWYGVVMMAGAHALPRGRAWAAGWIALAAASSIAIVTFRRDASTVMMPNPQWRELARVIRADANIASTPPGGRIGVISTSPLLPLRHYAPELDLVLIPVGADHLAQATRLRHERGWSSVWIINAVRWSPCPDSQWTLIESLSVNHRLRDLRAAKIVGLR